ncbi:MAG: LytR C-terminal domain-containing protein [Aeromicrobium sp.]
MVDHRRTPGRKAYVLPGWFLLLTAAACFVGLIGLGWAAFFMSGGDEEPVSAATASAAPAPSSTPSPTPSASEPSPSESPTGSAEPKPEVSRDDITVSVLNASRTVGLAKQVATRVTSAGWTVANVANWQTGAAQNAVHFPAGRKAEARLLAKDLGIDAVLPTTAGMSTDRLTVILLRLP